MTSELPPPEDVVSLYRRAFAEHGPRALWNMRPSDDPTTADALANAGALSRTGRSLNLGRGIRDGQSRRTVLLLHRRFNRLQLFSRLAPFALRGELAIAAQVIAHLLQARVPGGRWSARRRLRARRRGLRDQLLRAPGELRQCLLVGVGVDQPVAHGQHYFL